MAVSNKELLKNIKADFELAKRLTDEEEGRIVKQIRAILPPVNCPTGCSSCCSTIGPSVGRFFSRWEWAQIEHKKPVPDSGACPYLVLSRCSIYQDRPLICRLYGATPGALLDCGHAKPQPPLPWEMYKAIERMRYVMMMRFMPSRERKAAYKRIVKDIKSGGSSNQNVKSFMEMWKDDQVQT